MQHRNLSRRRLEDVDYWRKRAGWFDDDKTMKEYNSGVYDTYYQIDDDGTRRHRHRGFGGGKKLFSFGSKAEWIQFAIKIGIALVAIGLAILLYRLFARRMADSRKEKKRSDSRTRSKSRSRSRSRSRKGDYDLMDDDDGKSDARSRRSSRSRSKSGRSRSRTRSHSKSRSDSKTEPVLV